MPGELFVPIVAERDGHDFIDAARSSGASAWLTSRDDDRPGAIHVTDTAEALSALGIAARRRLPERVIGITGSTGKTSTKDLLAAVLRAQGPIAASEKSFNNELGVPLTLLDAPADAIAAVIEMGARGIGHIAALCAVARPTVGIVTNVGLAHLAMYDGPEGIVRAKGELVEALPQSGVAVLNADDASRPEMTKRTRARVVLFSAPLDGSRPSAEAEVVAAQVTMDEQLRPHFLLHTPWGDAPVLVGARGRHQVANAVAAAAAALSTGSTLEHVVAGMATEDLSPWRMEMSTTATGALVVNDAYNANPSSMAAALRALAELPARRRIAVLGTMAELGAAAAVEHPRMVELARSLRIDQIITVAEPAYGIATLVDVDDAAAALDALGLGDGDAVLVKGSRMAGLERLAQRLTGTTP